MITEANKPSPLLLTLPGYYRTDSNIWHDQAITVFLNHCGLTEAVWHLFGSTLNPPSPCVWAHDLTFSPLLRPVDKQKLDGRLLHKGKALRKWGRGGSLAFHIEACDILSCQSVLQMLTAVSPTVFFPQCCCTLPPVLKAVKLSLTEEETHRFFYSLREKIGASCWCWMKFKIHTCLIMGCSCRRKRGQMAFLSLVQR